MRYVELCLAILDYSMLSNCGTESHQGDLYPQRGPQGSSLLWSCRCRSLLGDLFEHLLPRMGNQQQRHQWLWLFALWRDCLFPPPPY